MTKLLVNSKSKTADTFASSGVLQRKCACGGAPGPAGECEGCRRKRPQGKALPGSQTNTRPSSLDTGHDFSVPSVVHEVLRSPGQPLVRSARAFMEPRFGHDFSGVRVHTDARAWESAISAAAYAYSFGSHIVFVD